jgi:hypothetical protein
MRFLKRLLPSQDIDALLGDIAEESRRRSRLWYWSQIAAAIVVGSWRDVRKHPSLAVRAVATGLVTLTIYFTIVAAIAQVMWVLANGGYYLAGYWLTLPRGPLPSPYGELAVLTVNALGFGLSGWAVVRFHRDHGLATAMPFLVIVTLLALILLRIVVTDSGPGTRTMPIVQMIWTFGSLFLSIPGAVFLGGLLGTQPSRKRSLASG